MSRLIRAALLFAALLSPVAASIAQEPAPSPVARIQSLIAQRPNDAALWFFLARVQAQAGDVKATVASLAKVSELGDGYLPSPGNGFEKVWNDPAMVEAVRAMDKKLARMDYAPIAFQVEDPVLVPEGLAYDPKSDTFFMGSIAERRVVRIDAHGVVTEFAGNAAGLDAVLGVAVDAPRRRVYVVSTSALTKAGRANRRNAIVAFDIDNGRLVQRYDVPLAEQLNDVTVAFGGRVYTTDSGSGQVFELQADRPPRVLVGPGKLPGSNGLAASADAKRLYVAHATGIALVDTQSGEVRQVANRTRENISAIDGLYEYHGDLVGVENVTNPGRVVLMRLSRDGEAIEEVRTVLSHHHSALNEPTTGALRMDTGYFYLLAATGVGHFGEDGKISNLETMPAPTVLKVLLPH
jgi:hypothetical protein